MGNENTLHLPKLLLLLFLVLRKRHNVSMLLYVPVEYNIKISFNLFVKKVQLKNDECSILSFVLLEQLGKKEL